MNNTIIKSIVIICALFTNMNAYGEGANSSKAESIFGGFYNYDTGDYIHVAGTSDHRFPDRSSVFLNGFMGGQYFYCYEGGAKIENLLDVSPNTSQGNLQMDTALLSCYEGTPPKTITLNCLADGQYSDSYVSNGSSMYYGTTYKYHAKTNDKSAQCAIVIDGIDFVYSDSLGSISHIQYVERANQK